VTPTRAGPLSGIRILDLSIAATGPYATTLLADQGADVIKVERPGIGDIARWVGVQIDSISALYQMCNRGKRSIAIDLATSEGRDIVRQLATQSDVVVQNWRPGVADRLGVGYDDVRRDDLVYVSISGFGDEGPYAHKGAYDTVIQAYGGIASNEAGASGVPHFTRQVLADKVTALTAVQAITAALLARERGQGGQHVHLSMVDAVVSFLWIDAAGNEVLRDGDGSQPGSFAAAVKPLRFLDGWGVATPTSDANFIGMCQAFGVDGYEDPRVATATLRQKHPELTGPIIARCYESAATMTTADAMARMEAAQVPCGIVVSASELGDDRHAKAIGILVDSVHPIAGHIRQPRHPIQFDGTPASLGAPAPALGAHTDEILQELGLTNQIDALRASGVVA
jgi:crotonobetainyl-CoA:carnitine CoA-transferase CaiB-like acyl-CoA transferase